jgi:hypothetical protein
MATADNGILAQTQQASLVVESPSVRRSSRQRHGQAALVRNLSTLILDLSPAAIVGLPLLGFKFYSSFICY